MTGKMFKPLYFLCVLVLLVGTACGAGSNATTEAPPAVATEAPVEPTQPPQETQMPAETEPPLLLP